MYGQKLNSKHTNTTTFFKSAIDSNDPLSDFLNSLVNGNDDLSPSVKAKCQQETQYMHSQKMALDSLFTSFTNTDQRKWPPWPNPLYHPATPTAPSLREIYDNILSE